jgi:hypothetical protein
MLDLLEIILEPPVELLFELFGRLLAGDFKEFWNWIVTRMV